MSNQEIIDKSKHICCKDKISVSATGLFLQKPFGITYFYSEDGKEWLKTDAAIFAHSRSLADIKRITDLEKTVKSLTDAVSLFRQDNYNTQPLIVAYKEALEPKP